MAPRLFNKQIMKKVRFTRVYGVRNQGEIRSYPDQFADWLVEIHVAELYIDPQPLPAKTVKAPEKKLKEAKPVAKITKQEKGKRVTK